MASALGGFLAARRATVRPRDVGLSEYGTRKVTGLRREEVAVVAALSVEYYTRLEQGRELHPSPQILDALAQTFDLDPDEVGELTLTYLAFDVRTAPGQELLVYQAEPGSASAKALALLGSLTANGRRPVMSEHRGARQDGDALRRGVRA